MPYRSNQELPAQVKVLPEHAKTIWRKAFNNSYLKYGEDRARQIAWGAVKKSYKKVGGIWVKKERDTAEDPSKNGWKKMNIEELFKKILKKIRTGKISDAVTLFKEVMTIDFKATKLKYDALSEGKLLVIYDVPIAKEMVQLYGEHESDFPGYHYKPRDSIEKLFVEYNPLAVGHPSKHFYQMTDEEIKERTIGYLNDGYFKNGKKYANLYFFLDKTPEWIISKIKNKDAIEVSIGFKSDIVPANGEFDGRSYNFRQDKIRLDHLAIVPPELRARAPFTEGVGIGADSNSFKTNKKQKGGLLKVEDVQKLIDALEKGAKTATSDAIKKLQEVQDMQKKITELEGENQTLKDELEEKKVAELKDKAEKYDKLMEDQEKAEEEKVKELTDEILEIRDDEEIRKFIEGQDSKKLQFVLDELKGNKDASVKGLPPKKKEKEEGKDGKDEDLAEKHMREKYKEETGKEVLE